MEKERVVTMFSESEYAKHEQFISTQVRKITSLSLEDRSGEALKLALDLVERHGGFPLVHRCIAKVYQRLDQMEIALKHHDIADQLSEQYFKSNPNPEIPRIPPSFQEFEKEESALVQTDSQEKAFGAPSVPLTIKSNKKSTSFDQEELLELRDQLIQATKKNDLEENKGLTIESIPTIKVDSKMLAPSQQMIIQRELDTSEAKSVENEANFKKPRDETEPVSSSLSYSSLVAPNDFEEMQKINWLKEEPLSKEKLEVQMNLPTNLSLKQAITLFRETYIQQVYDACGQDVEKTAKVLDLSEENIRFVIRG